MAGRNPDSDITYQEVFENWGIPDITGTPEYQALLARTKTGFGGGYVYDKAMPEMQGIANKAAAERRAAMYGLDTKFGSSFALGAGGRLQGDMRAQTASQLAGVLLDARSANEQARQRAQGTLLSVLMGQQGTIANVMASYKGMELEEELTEKQLKASETVSWIVGAEYGLTSVEEKLMQIWKNMKLRMAHGKRWKLELWRVVFTGYHRAAPWVVSQSMRSSVLLRLRKRIVENFVRYVLCDIWRPRKPKLSERMAAAAMLAISLAGWRFKNG